MRTFSSQAIALAVLFLALGGSAYAVATITGASVKDGSLTVAFLGQLDLPSAGAPDGKPVPLPAGDWVVDVTGLFDNIGNSERDTECRVMANPEQKIIGFTNSITVADTIDPGAEIPLVMSTAHTFESAGELQLECVGQSVRLRGVTVRAVCSGDVQVVQPG